jgi:acyl carrier protein
MDTAARIYNYLDERFSPASKRVRLTGDTLLLYERVLDSVGMLELVCFVEETFGIQVPEEDIVPDNFDTINKLAAYVDRIRLPSAR